ncbi:MAG: Kef family K(+) transporter [Alphaproteobacteria bacterium]|nr:Kef family K(+) transporter [Alphaproteobacteria bacterium]
MIHHTPLITTVVVGLVLASLLGAIARFFRISPIVGYLVAGIIVGPYTPGFSLDQALAAELAEIGVILLMFGVGLHFSLNDLLSVRSIAIPGALAQIAIATLLGMSMAWFMGWPIGGGIVFGLALSVASTVVLLRTLQDRHILDTERGKIAVGWLIVEDIAMVFTLVLLPALADFLKSPESAGALASGNSADILLALGKTIGKLVTFVILMLVVGRRVIPWVLHYTIRTGSPEMFRLTVLAVALGVAYGSALMFGVSFALGAFFAGMILAESELSHQAATESLPLRDAFAVLFFVSVGLLVDPMIIVNDPLAVLATVFIIMFGKSIAAFLIVLAFRHPLSTALTISVSLAQIGEFSFILAGLGVTLGLLPDRGRELILAGALLSIFFNPLLFIMADRIILWVNRHHPLKSGKLDLTTLKPDVIPQQTTLKDHAIIVGFGRVGHLVAEAMTQAHIPLLVMEENPELIEELRSRHIEYIYGNAATPSFLEAANIEKARWLLVAMPNVFEAGYILQKARSLNPDIEIITRAHSKAEIDYLKVYGAEHIIMGEHEIAKAMLNHVLGKEDDSPLAPPPETQPA